LVDWKDEALALPGWLGRRAQLQKLVHRPGVEAQLV
jgi:hypothetical protein